MIQVTYIDLSADNTTPLMQLKEVGGSRSIHIAVSDYDANRLALHSFKLLKFRTDGVAESLIKTLGVKLVKVQFFLQSPQKVHCEVVVAQGAQHHTLEVRPGEAVLLALKFQADILVEESLFYTHNDAISLRDRLRALSTVEFGHAVSH